MTVPYRPANGTEGMIFDDGWCSHCQRDAAWREDENSADCCDILSRSLACDIDDPDYPTEWVQDESGPRCTAFVAIGTEGSTHVDDDRQIELPI